MSWKKHLTNLKRLMLGKKPMPEPNNPGRRPEHEPIAQIMPVSEAVKAIPKEMIQELEDYRSVKAHNAKLDQDQQLELMEFIARFASIEEINAYFVPTHGVSISQPLVNQYRHTKKWQPIIKKLREKYLISEDEVPGFHKKVRMERNDKIYEKAFKDGDLKTALQANKQQKEEMTKDEGNLSLTLNQYNYLTDEELQEKIAEAREKIAKLTAVTVQKEEK